MPRLAFVADVHVGNHKLHGGRLRSSVNERALSVLQSLKAASIVSSKAGCDALIAAGDLFDETKPSPQLVRATQEVLEYGPERHCLLVGNHELVSDQPSDHGLASYNTLPDSTRKAEVWEADQAHTFSSAQGTLQIIAIPFRTGPGESWFESAVASAVQGADLSLPTAIVFHLGVWDEDTPEFLRTNDDVVSLSTVVETCARHKIRFAFCGNYHNAKKWYRRGVSVIQCGALHPTGWSNPGFDYGRVWFWDGKKVEYEVVPGIRFLKASTLEEVQAALERGRDTHNSAWVRWQVSADRLADARASLESIKVRSNERVDVVVDKNAAKQKAIAVTAALAESKGEDDAVEKFINKMTVPPGTDKNAVKAVVKGYLR